MVELWKCISCGDKIPETYDACPHCSTPRYPSLSVRPCLTAKRDNTDNINHPPHYNAHPSGIEQIEISKYWSFCLGNVLKYIWRCDYKGKPIEDLKKARFYLDCEIKLRESK